MFRYLGEKPSRRWHRIVWLYSSIARHKVKIQFKTSRWLIDWWRQWYHSRCVRVKHQKSMHDGSKHAKDFQHGRQSKGSRTLKMSDRSNQTGLSVVQMKRDFFYTFHMQSHKDLWRFLVGELPWNVSGLSTEQGTEIKPVRCDTNWSISLQVVALQERKRETWAYPARYKQSSLRGFSAYFAEESLDKVDASFTILDVASRWLCDRWVVLKTEERKGVCGFSSFDILYLGR